MPVRPVKGSEQGGIRPALVVQNDMGNRLSPAKMLEVSAARAYDLAI